MSEYSPLHCTGGRHGRVRAADTGSALQRPELDVCLSAGAATGLCRLSGPGHQTVTWQSAALQTLIMQDSPLTLADCHQRLILASWLGNLYHWLSPSNNSYPRTF